MATTKKGALSSPGSPGSYPPHPSSGATVLVDEQLELIRRAKLLCHASHIFEAIHLYDAVPSLKRLMLSIPLPDAVLRKLASLAYKTIHQANRNSPRATLLALSAAKHPNWSSSVLQN